MFEFVFVPFRMVGPNMLDFVTIFALTLNVLNVPAGQTRPSFYMVRHSSQNAMNLSPIRTVEVEPVI